MNNRRKLLIALGARVLTAPFASFAQAQGKVWRIGFLALRGRPDSFDTDPFGGFPLGMRELGYVEGKNLIIEWRFADGKTERIPSLATEFVQLKVDVIVAVGPQAISAAQKATTAIPIVMASVNDPVGSGFIKSLAHPGGNITGVSNQAGDLGPKQFELLRAMVPKLAHVAFLLNPTNSGHAPIMNTVRTAAQRVGVKVLSVEARTPNEIEKAFSMMIRQNTRAVIVPSDPVFIQQLNQIAALAAKARMASIFWGRPGVEAGGLMSYGTDTSDIFRRAATYVDKILKGAKPGDLPVEQPTKFELIINDKTAKALGLTIPQSLLISADKVIE